MQVKAILCDAATVREGLLHILGGGITRLWRERYPSTFKGALALTITPEASEVGEEHVLQVKVMGDDRQVGELQQQFTVNKGEDMVAGEVPAIPVVLPFDPPLPIERPGSYRIDILIDRSVVDTVGFVAKPAGQRPT